MIKAFSPREREAVEYLRWQKDKIQENYHKFTGARELPSNLRSLDQRWEDFVDLSGRLPPPQTASEIH